MQTLILEFLKKNKQKTVLLSKLQELAGGDVTYEEFAGAILQLCEYGLMTPIKAAGENKKSPSLYYQFRINRVKLNEDYKKRVHTIGLSLHNEINISEYFSLTEKEFESDLPYIMKLDSYLKENGIPIESATSAERSYQIFDDEKVIDEKSGKRILERVKLFDKMKINSAVDPAMFFINKEALYHNDVHYHLIIENRTTFYQLSDIIENTVFTSLIYGCGFKISAGLDIVERQLNLQCCRHIYYYFGDLDNSGILIWHILYEKKGVLPALPFYTALLQKNYFKGKENQKRNAAAIECFKTFFSAKDGCQIDDMLKNAGYYPQETLTKGELQKIWSDNDWILM